MNAKFDHVSKFFPRLLSHIDVIIFYLGAGGAAKFSIFFASLKGGGGGGHIFSLTFTKKIVPHASSWY